MFMTVAVLVSVVTVPLTTAAIVSTRRPRTFRACYDRALEYNMGGVVALLALWILFTAGHPA